MNARKWEIFAAAAAGAAIATTLGGCAFMFMATARADDTQSFQCTKAGQTFEYTLPDETPETLARLSVVTQGASGAFCKPEATGFMIATGGSAINGKVTLTCPASCADGRNVTFALVLR